MQNLFEIFSAGFRDDASRPLLIAPNGDTCSFATADRESARLARALTALGLTPGDRVTVQAPKSPQVLWLYLACLRAGFVYQPLNDAYRESELKYFVTDATPKLVVCAPEHLDLFARLTGELECQVLTLDAKGCGSLIEKSAETPAEFETITCDRDTVAALIYSSGTTGQPKGAMLTHANLIANVNALVETWGFSSADRLLHALPIYHAHGLFVAIGCVMASGASMIFLPGFEARETIRHLDDATVMMGVPTFYTRMLDVAGFGRNDCKAMRLFISGSAPLRAETHREFAARTGQEILERYGMTETGMNSSNPLRGERRPGSVGRPLPGVEIRVVDADDRTLAPNEVGEIQVRGDHVFAGYRGMPDKTAEAFTTDGFFRTGDQGVLSRDGYLSIVGRNSDMIITGGLNVYPREVEQVIDSMEGVAESAVIGVPDPDFGEAVVAVIVADPTGAPSEAQIISAVGNKIANFKKPKRVFFVEELPRNTMSKVEKNTLRNEFQRALT
jgi:malonyl-CoA/methylmalonyl-CoA synthetase